VFQQPIQGPAYYNIATPIKDRNGVLLRNREDILGRLRDYSKDPLNAVIVTQSSALEIHFGEQNTIIATKVFLAIKTMKARKAAVCDGNQHEMLKRLNRSVFSCLQTSRNEK